jgi:hypothetical protein
VNDHERLLAHLYRLGELQDPPPQDASPALVAAYEQMQFERYLARVVDEIAANRP